MQLIIPDTITGRTRTQLINALTGYKSLHLVGTKNSLGQLNCAPFSSVFHLGADPACIGLIHRPTTVEKHTYENILESGFYTINAVSTHLHERAHQASARYERHESEFEACGLTPEFKNNFFAPFVADSPIQIGLELHEEHKIFNGTHLLVGLIKQVYLPENSFTENGFLNLEKLNLAAVGGLDSYYSGQFLEQYSYAKPDQKLIRLTK
jgi:flavin reductase (DIM6/NTAB) family NADH-FMN oxidoreductase RutF